MSHGAKMFRAAAVATVCVVGMALWSGSQEGRPKTSGKDSGDSQSPAAAKELSRSAGSSGTSAGNADEAADEAVFKKLSELTEFSFKETPLKDAMAAISRKHKLTIVINYKYVEEANVSAKTPLTRTARDVSLETALTELLHEIGLDYIVRDEAVEVTSRDVADTFLVHRIYGVADLVVPPGAADAEPDYQSLIDLIAQIVHPDSWKDVGGSAAATQLPGCLLIDQTIARHRQVQVVFQALRKARKLAGESGPPSEHSLRILESPGDQRIEETLRRRASVSFADSSLHDIVNALSKKHGIAAELDRKRLEEADVDPAKGNWTFAADDISLCSALKWLLRDRGLSWIVRDGRLLITSREQAESYIVTRFYPVADLVPDGGFKAPRERANFGLFGPAAVLPAADDWLLRTIKDTVLPDHWHAAGGPGVIDWAPHVPLLVCTIHQDGHRELERFLADLRKHVAKPPGKAASEASRQPAKALWAYPIAAASADTAKLASEAAKLIQEKIAPESWNGKDTDALIRAWPDRIVVRHTAKVHREVQKLLQEVGLLKPPDAVEPPTPPPSDD